MAIQVQVLHDGRPKRVRLQGILALLGSLVVGCSAASEESGSVQSELSGAGDVPLWIVQLSEYSTVTGVGNNQGNPQQGAANTNLLRTAPVAYADGQGALAGPNRASARVVSNTVADQSQSVFNAVGATDMLWLWGQFVDHDIDLTLTGTEEADIPVPSGDPFFDPFETGKQVIEFERSIFNLVHGVRQQPNDISSYIDATNVYGSTPDRTQALRKLDGSGEMKTSSGDLLPFNVDGLPNAGGTGDELFVAGDIRANEQIYLTAMHTLWVREHNAWARAIKLREPWMNGDQVFSLARAMVAAEIQSITYNEFLPVLLGENALPEYTGYKPGVNAAVSNEFSAAAYRLGHSMLNGTLLRLNSSGNSIPEGPIALRDAFFNPAALVDTGIEPLLFGIVGQRAQEIDNLIVDDVRNFLFGPPGSGGLDLASLNLQRGRDHGLADYNSVRQAFGLPKRTSFNQISSNPNVRARLQAAYSSVNDMDLWITGLSEDHVPGAMLGETFHTIVRDQFVRLRDGDRFYFESYLPEHLRVLARHTRLSTVMRRNAGASVSNLRHEVMREVQPAASQLFGFESSSRWNVTGASKSTSSIRTDGQRSLQVRGGGSIMLVSQKFSASQIGNGDQIWFDVSAPANPPNPFVVGTVDTFLDCPSAGVWGAWIANTDVTNFPRGQFNTVQHTIPGWVLSRLRPNTNDCRVTIWLIANPASQIWRFDRMRFR